MYVVTGENGIGKTTFLKGMLGLFNEYTGNVYYSDENLGKIDKFYLRKIIYQLCYRMKKFHI